MLGLCSSKRLVGVSIAILMLIVCALKGYDYEVSESYGGSSSHSDPIDSNHVGAGYFSEYDDSAQLGDPCDVHIWVFGHAIATVLLDAAGNSGSWNASSYVDLSPNLTHTWEWNGPPGTEPNVTINYSYRNMGWADIGGYILLPDQGSALICGSSETYGYGYGDGMFYADGEAQGWATNNGSWNGAEICLSPYQDDVSGTILDQDPNDSDYGATAWWSGVTAEDEYTTSGTFSIITAGSVHSSVSAYMTAPSGSYKWLYVEGEGYYEVNSWVTLDYN